MHGYKPGDLIKVSNLKQRFTVKAVSDRYVIATKPFNLRKTVQYFIADFEEGWRAPINLIFSPYDFKVQADIDECLKDLESGRCGLSRRHGIKLDLPEKPEDVA